jgi:rhodanese-related sulfurtransferase
MIPRRTFFAVFGAASALPGLALAEPKTITARKANQLLQNDKLILIDVRTPPEWQETGVAQGAWMLDMTHRDFGGWLMTAINRNPGHQIAIICRTGSRTGRLAQVLEQNGITDVLDVTEGMIGGPRGKGWIPSNLPIVSAQAAFDVMPKDLKARN